METDYGLGAGKCEGHGKWTDCPVRRTALVEQLAELAYDVSRASNFASEANAYYIDNEMSRLKAMDQGPDPGYGIPVVDNSNLALEKAVLADKHHSMLIYLNKAVKRMTALRCRVVDTDSFFVGYFPRKELTDEYKQKVMAEFREDQRAEPAERYDAESVDWMKAAETFKVTYGKPLNSLADRLAEIHFVE